MNGIPRVIEDPGLRSGPSLKDGSITIEPHLPRRYYSRCSTTDSPMKTRRLQPMSIMSVMGIVTLRPLSDPVMVTKSNVTITASVDGQLLGMANTTPYQFTWDTRKSGERQPQ